MFKIGGLAMTKIHNGKRKRKNTMANHLPTHSKPSVQQKTRREDSGVVKVTFIQKSRNRHLLNLKIVLSMGL